MNQNGILTSWEELHLHGFNLYKPIPEEGIFLLHLDFKAWHKNREKCLICYFTSRNGERYKLYTWKKKNGTYAPKLCNLDFSLIGDSTWWYCNIQTNSTGYRSWIDAWRYEKNTSASFRQGKQ